MKYIFSSLSSSSLGQTFFQGVKYRNNNSSSSLKQSNMASPTLLKLDVG